MKNSFISFLKTEYNEAPLKFIIEINEILEESYSLENEEFDEYIEKFIKLSDYYILTEGSSDQINISGHSLNLFKPIYNTSKEYFNGKNRNIEESKIFFYKLLNIFQLISGLMKAELYLDSYPRFLKSKELLITFKEYDAYSDMVLIK
jgi:hypothetical protein